MKILTLIHCRYYQVWTFKPAIILYIFFSSLIMLSVYFRLDGNRYGVWCFWPSWSRRDVPHAASWYGKYYIAIWFCFVSSSDPNDCERCCHLWAVVIFCEMLSSSVRCCPYFQYIRCDLLLSWKSINYYILIFFY